MFQGIYNKRRVLVTGFSGFKGAYLAYFLHRLGAEICGVALPVEEPSLCSIARIEKLLRCEYCDIRDREKLEEIIQNFKPEMVFHLAAQSLVRKSYKEPVETFSTNVMGTVNLLECCRICESIRSIVVISSDKCYENRETLVPYKESDPLGGYDPYSASKGCTEIVAASYRKSFFPVEKYGKTHQILLGSCRAGNVVGGGDYACDRLIPDLVRGALEGKETLLRNPDSVRPWQHVWEPLSGYLALGAELFSGKREFAQGWNFGPEKENIVRVGEAAGLLQKYWGKIRIKIYSSGDQLHEANLLLLDSSKAREKLSWQSIWNMEKTFMATAQWYSSYHEEGIDLLEKQYEEYIYDAVKANVKWSIL
ncbi:MAG: CDP-glucose 4,6-dehydratase [Lentisphaeria bacterium]|nr:CDP-glucose 4,6-dehydratase [Lentisphaeria bacterium]